MLFLMFWSVAIVDLKQQRNRVCACLQTIKTNLLERRYQNSNDMRFFQDFVLHFKCVRFPVSSKFDLSLIASLNYKP